MGGIAAIAISHPHYYSSMAEWAEAVDAPIYLHAADREWVLRPSDPPPVSTAARFVPPSVVVPTTIPTIKTDPGFGETRIVSSDRIGRYSVQKVGSL